MHQPTLALCIPESPSVVPVRDWTAASLLDIVSSPDQREKKRALSQLLTVDPAFLLWSALCREEVRSWRDLTIEKLSSWLAARIGDLLLRCHASMPHCQQRCERLFDAQVSTITVARSACASLNGARAEIGSIVYSGALLAFVRDWLYLPEGRLACEAAVPSWLPGWLNLLLAETNSAHVPSIEFMKPIRSAIESCETDLSRYVGAAELQQWESEFPIIRSVFAKNLKHLQSLQDRQSADAARVETAKLVAMKELAYGASHEINNPLANISTRAQLLMKDEPDDDRKRQLATITRQAYRAHEMISDLMLFAKPPKIEKSSFDLKDFFDRLTSSLESDVELRSAVITFDVAEPLEIAADAQQLEVALRSIIKNSIEASDTSCAISIKCRLSDMSARSLDRHADRFVEIEIADDGPGVSPEVRRHLFDPFYSGREAGRGLGFGLSKAWRIVEQHGGQIIVDSPNNGGLTLTMRIPME